MDLQDSITLECSPSTGPSPEKILVFFITGNPGLIEYYRTFLTLCFDGLRTKYADRHIKVTGTSLRGFSVQEPEFPHPQTKDYARGPYDLEQQIEYIGQALERVIKSDGDEIRKTNIILMGHSVGSYILLEVLRRRKERANAQGLSNDARVVGGICLFPTVTHIAKSPSGKKFSSFFAIPCFALIAGLAVRLLFYSIPFQALRRLVGLITGFPSSAAETTTAFLKSPDGVRQALYLAGHEMRTITADVWDDELWGVSVAQEPTKDKTKLYFYFGTNDHWVADETRDELIAARAATNNSTEETKPTMEIDTEGTPHGFCIKHNELVARKVEQYMRELMQMTW